MGRLFVVNLEGKIYSCKHCRTHLALFEDIVSKVSGMKQAVEDCGFRIDHCRTFSVRPKVDPSFHCKHGKAYLFNKVVNVTVGEKEERLMMTGLHTVADIFCVGCGSIVGWTYDTAHEKNQKYKEGKSVLERFKVIGPDGNSYWGVGHQVHGGSDADDA